MSTNFTHLIQSWLTQSGAGSHAVRWIPPVDIYRIDGGWLVKFDLAGVRPSDIRLEIRSRNLTVSGRRRDWVVEESHPCSAYSMEITYSHFERTLEFPSAIEHLQVRTEYRDGMLLVHLHDPGGTR